MPSLLTRWRGHPDTQERSTLLGYDFQQWLIDSTTFGFNGSTYGAGSRQERPDNALATYADRLHGTNGVLAAAITTRALLLKQVKFVYRRVDRGAAFREFFTSLELAPLEQPDPRRMTLPQMLAAMELHVSLAGNAYVRRHLDNRLELLNPDCVDVVIEGGDSPSDTRRSRKAGYVYYPDGRAKPETKVPLMLEEVAHWMPEPHPSKWWMGQSWVTAVVREVLLDLAGTEYVDKFFEKAATPNMVIRPDASMTPERIKQYKELFDDRQAGLGNAWKAMWVGGGSDVTMVGSTLDKLDLKNFQGGLETRIAARSRIPAVILGIREGLAGSSLNAGNYSSARRMLADGWFTPTVQDLCATLAHLFPPPPGGPAELWYDPTDVLFLQEDAKDAADIAQVQAQAIRSLVDGGYDPTTAVTAVVNNNFEVLQHTGKLSVQLQEPGASGDGPDLQTARALSLVEQIQKIYLGVGKVVTVAEARQILNQGGANLSGPGPDLMSQETPQP